MTLCTLLHRYGITPHQLSVKTRSSHTIRISMQGRHFPATLMPSRFWDNTTHERYVGGYCTTCHMRRYKGNATGEPHVNGSSARRRLQLPDDEAACLSTTWRGSTWPGLLLSIIKSPAHVDPPYRSMVSSSTDVLWSLLLLSTVTIRHTSSGQTYRCHLLVCFTSLPPAIPKKYFLYTGSQQRP